eukprot:gene10704-12449_t
MAHLGHRIMRAFTISLGLPRDTFDDPLHHQASLLRLLKYPPMDPTSENISCGPHTDYGYFTMLYQDSVGGLEVKNAKGDWIKATPMEGSLVVNIGDLIQRMTNDLYVSTTHRVMNLSNGFRYSMPYFFDPHYDYPIHSLENIPGHPPKYPPTTFGEYLYKSFGQAVTDKKSKFQAHLAIVHSEEEVKAVLDTLLTNKKIADATHNMYAYRFKLPDGCMNEYCNDDGEAGAGDKMLFTLIRSNCEGVLIVVTHNK